MSLENATKISELVATNPPGTDPVSQGDDHIRMIKNVLQQNAIKSEIGQSSTPANNFTLDASADNGTMKLARNSGQDIMTVDAAGKVAFPQNPARGSVLAWGRYNGTAGTMIGSSQGLSGVKNATGSYTFTLSAEMPSGAAIHATTAIAGGVVCVPRVEWNSPTSFSVYVYAMLTSVAADTDHLSISVLG